MSEITWGASALHKVWSVVAVGVLTGCTSLSGQIGQNAVDYNQAVADMSTEVAFLNVLRSRDRLPRSYTALSQIQGNLNATVGGEVGVTTPLGDSEALTLNRGGTGPTRTDAFTYAGPSLAPKFSGSFTSDPNFTVAVLATQEFYQGILRPLSVGQVALFLSQGWRSDMIAHLMIESVRFEYDDGTLLEVVNHPSSDLWRQAANNLTLYAKQKKGGTVPLSGLTGKELALLVEQGLGVKANGPNYQVAHPPGGLALGLVGDIDQVCLLDEGKKDEVSNCSFTSQGIKVLSGKCLREEETSERPNPFQRCLTPHLLLVKKSLEGGKILLEEDSALSRQLPLFPQPAYSYGNGLASDSGDLKLTGVTLITRNTDGVIHAVGEYLNWLRGGTKDQPRNPIEIKCKRSASGECSRGQDDPLFVVRSGSPNRVNGALVSGALNGERWYVPATGAGRSMQVLSLVDQLVNLNKASKTLPTPTFIRVQ